MAGLELDMSDVKEKEETGQELPDGSEDKQQNDVLRQAEPHDLPESMERNSDPDENSSSGCLPMEEEKENPCSNGHLTPETETGPASDDNIVEPQSDHGPDQSSPPSSPLCEDQTSVKPEIEASLDAKLGEEQELAEGKTGRENESTISLIHTEVAEAASKDPTIPLVPTEVTEAASKDTTISLVPTEVTEAASKDPTISLVPTEVTEAASKDPTISLVPTEVTEEVSIDSKIKASGLPEGHNGGTTSVTHIEEPVTPHYGCSDRKAENESGEELIKGLPASLNTTPVDNGNSNSKHSFLFNDDHMYYEGSESGTEEDQSEFMKELENFFKERSMEFKPPKFYGEGLNCLKLWRAVTKLGGYEKVTSCKLWRQVGESFKPPKTCTTVSWTFRGFYEKALLDYERHKTSGGELMVPFASHVEPLAVENQALGSGRARRDAASRAMQGWHSQRLLGNGEVSDPIIKDKNSMTVQKREKQLKNVGLIKRKNPTHLENPVKAARTKISKAQVDTAVVDIGVPADWVKINVQKTKDCYEVYALVPGLLREEVRVQSDPAGRLVISGEPEQPDNPWGVTPFKKVVSLPSRIDPHQTSAVVTLHGQLFIRAPLEQIE